MGVKPWDLLKTGVEKASIETQKNRMSICEACPSLKLGFCDKCGCRMKWKTTLKHAICPINKWGAEA